MTVYGYKRMKATIHDSDRYVEQLLEDLDEEYSDPWGDGTESFAERSVGSSITDEMKLIGKERGAPAPQGEAFVDKILALYTVWSCEHVVTKQVKVTSIDEHGFVEFEDL